MLSFFQILMATFSFLWFLWLFIRPKPPARSPPFPPGPRGLPIIGNLPFLKPDLHVYFMGLSKTYGPIFKLRLGAKLAVVVSSPEVAREMLKIHDVTFSSHDVTATAMTIFYGGKDLAFSPYGPEWRLLRKVWVQRLMSKATLDSNYGLRRREVRQTVRFLSDQARIGSPVNLGEHIFVTMMNTVTQMLWGEDRESIGAEFKDLVSEIVDLIGRPNVSDFFPGLSRFDLQGLDKQTRGLVQRLDRIFDRVINQRMKLDGQSQTDDQDFLNFLLKLKDEDATIPLSMNNVKALLMNMVLAGTDTSSSVIEFAMAELISKPEMMKRVQQEIDEVVGKRNIVEEFDIGKLPYLLAVMKETLRLHPTGPLLVPYKPSQTTIVADYTIPKDTKVFFNVWAMHRDPNLWDNPSEFNPDRFLVKSYDFNGNDFSYLPFGSGRRMCAGIALAERMVLYILATLLHSFDWNISEGQNLVIEEKFGLVLSLKNPLVAIPTLRLLDPNLYM